MQTIAHISDLHVSSEYWIPPLGDRLAQEMERLNPDLLIVAGDLCFHDGDLNELRQAKAYLDGLRCRQRLIVPGNHDVSGCGDALANYRAVFGDPFQVINENGFFVVGIDSTEVGVPGDQWHSQGYLGAPIYDWLRRQFATADANDLKILAMHHHLIAVPGTGNDQNILLDAGDVIEVLLESGVDLVLGGHRHRGHLWQVENLRILHSGTCTSCRYYGEEKSNSYNIIRVGRDVSIHRRYLNQDRTVLVRRFRNRHWQGK